MYITINRAVVIASIIEKRRPLAEKIASVENNLQTLSEALRSLEEHRKLLLTQVDEDIIRRLREIDLTSSQSRIEDERLALSQLKARFNRKTLNIGVVGRARQGKSRLLQSLTGLSAAEIPDGDRQHCTGVRSTIYHSSSSETYGEVWFHSERSFLNEVIAPYYEKLQLGAKPISIEEFASKPLPTLPQNLPGFAEPGAMYEHLQRYYTNFDKFRHLLKETSPRRIAKSQIREYVAQDTLDGQRIYFNYLAVKEVKIFCEFPNVDVGNIALVDMPGLGDTGIGDEERLMKTLGQDVDAVLFVRMPKSSGDYWADVDVRLYDVARASLQDLPLDLWSFMVLNHTSYDSKNGDNYNNCQDLAGDISNKRIQVTESIIANCANTLEANKVLDKLLDHFAAKISDLDQKYAFTCQERLLQFQNQVSTELVKAKSALGQQMHSNKWFPVFQRLFDELWENLSDALEKQLSELRKQRNEQDIDFQQQVNAAIEACRNNTGVPSIEQIERRRNKVGGYPNAYFQYLNEIRAHLSKHFLSLDEGLRKSLLRVKTQIASTLIEEGRLGGLVETRGHEFLNSITNQIPESLGIKQGFEILAEFDISYRGLIQHRIRKHLDGVTPDTTNLQLSDSPSAKEILANLKALHAEATYGCETALLDLLCEPSLAAFAIVEEFVDRVLRAEGVETEWRIFYEEVRSEVWSEEFAQLGESTRLHQQWMDSVEKAIIHNEAKLISFLN